MPNSHNSSNPSDEQINQMNRDEQEESFSFRNVQQEVNRNLEKNTFGLDYQKKQQNDMAQLSALTMTKRQARQPSVIRRQLMGVTNKSHDYVSLLQQSHANFEAELSKYNHTFK
jgi:hypothetical protein